MEIQKKPVTLRALEQRINRRLAKEEEALKKARAGPTLAHFGRYYVVDLRTNALQQRHVQPVELAQTLGVLHPWECVKEEG